jgi:hypothetical protein
MSKKSIIVLNPEPVSQNENMRGLILQNPTLIVIAFYLMVHITVVSYGTWFLLVCQWGFHSMLCFQVTICAIATVVP